MTDTTVQDQLAKLLTTPLTTSEQAAAWVHAMHDIGYGAHPDDSGANLLAGNDDTDEYKPLFTEDEADAYDSRMEEVFALLDDPYQVSIEAMERLMAEAPSDHPSVEPHVTVTEGLEGKVVRLWRDDNGLHVQLATRAGIEISHVTIVGGEDTETLSAMVTRFWSR